MDKKISQKKLGRYGTRFPEAMLRESRLAKNNGDVIWQQIGNRMMEIIVERELALSDYDPEDSIKIVEDAVTKAVRYAESMGI